MPNDVDFRVMLTFVEFYASLVGFINFKLYHTLNLNYPPQVYTHTHTLSLLLSPSQIEGLAALPETLAIPSQVIDADSKRLSVPEDDHTEVSTCWSCDNHMIIQTCFPFKDTSITGP